MILSKLGRIPLLVFAETQMFKYFKRLALSYSIKTTLSYI